MSGDALFFAVYLGPLVVALALLWLAGVTLTRLSLPSVVVLFYLAFAHLGTLPLYFGWDASSIGLGVEDPALVVRMAMFAGLALVCFSAGVVYVRVVAGERAGWEVPRQAVGATPGELRIITLVFVIGVVVYAAYLVRVPSVALLHALRGDDAAAAVARSDMTNAFTGAYWRYRLFFRTGLDFCAVFFFAHYLAVRGRAAFVRFAVAAGAALFTAVAAIEKSPMAMLLLMGYLAYVYSRGGRFWQPATKYLAAPLLTAIAATYLLLMGAPSLGASFGFLGWRVLTGQLSPAYFYLDLFPERLPYLWGGSLPNPGGFLPFTSLPLTRIVQDYVVRTGTADVAGSSPTAFWGEAYANFGPLGVVGAAFLMGVVVAGVAVVLARCAPSPTTTAAVVMLAAHYSGLAMAGISNYLADTTAIFIFALAAAGLRCRSRDEP